MLTEEQTRDFFIRNEGITIVPSAQNDCADVYLNGKWVGELMGGCILFP